MNQTFVTIPIDEWNKMVSLMAKIEAKLTPKVEDEWVDTDKACEMLHISRSTWITYRKKYNIKQTQMGRKILVPKSEIDNILKDRFYE